MSADQKPNPNPKAPKSKEEIEKEKVDKLIAKGGDSNAGELLKRLQPIFEAVSKAFDLVYPPISNAVTKGIEIYEKLPMDIVYAIIGLILCFFGGAFALSLVAIEAFIHSGWDTVKYNAHVIYVEMNDLWKKSREDDKVDANNDGIPDNEQRSVRDLVTHKIAFFFANMKDPSKVMDMMSGIGNCLIAVLAVLKIDFAKILALGASIGEMMKKPAQSYLVPLLCTLLPTKFHQWISPVINYICKAVAISIAFIIQRIISAVQSAIRGGLLCARRLLKYFAEKGHVQFNDEESYLDEIIGWTLAFFGVYFQLRSAFALPFPLNLLLFPFTVFENFLSWAVAY